MSTSLHHRAVEHLGTRIVGGTLPTGHVMLAEHLEEELNVSRSVVREAVRVLQSLGLVETIKRVGIRSCLPTAGTPSIPWSSAGGWPVKPVAPSCGRWLSCAPPSSP